MRPCSSEATHILSHHAVAPLPTSKGDFLICHPLTRGGEWRVAFLSLHFLILFFSIPALWLGLQMLPTLASSFFSPRNCFQVTCCVHFSAALLTFAHLPVTLRAQIRIMWPVQSSENCEDYPCLSDSAQGQRWMGKWCCWRHFYLQTRLCFIPALPTPTHSPEGGKMQKWLTAGSDPLLPKP